MRSILTRERETAKQHAEEKRPATKEKHMGQGRRVVANETKHRFDGKIQPAAKAKLRRQFQNQPQRSGKRTFHPVSPFRESHIPL